MDIGIDLGTTYSVVAVGGNVELAEGYPHGLYLEEFNVTIVPTADGEMTFASALWEDPEYPGQLCVGTDALQAADDGKAPILFSKRKIGTREPFPLHGRTLTAREAAGAILAHIKTCAERALAQPVRRAVVTHPAYFDRIQVEETRQAAIDAGFDMSLSEQMLMEPIAAALAYIRTDRRDPLHVLTYDLGGGTFDVTYLVRRGGVISVKAFDGDHLLGGYNFDRELIHWILTRLAKKDRRIAFDETDADDRGRLAQLMRLAELTKIKLSKVDNDDEPVEIRAAQLLVDEQGRRVNLLERITRREYVTLLRPYLDRTVQCCRRALQTAGVEPDRLDEVLMVGGSTYGPWVKQALEEEFPGRPPRLFFPDLCVAAGAALHAAMVLPVTVESALYRLDVDVASSSALDIIDVPGAVKPLGNVGIDGLQVVLKLPGGETLGPQSVTDGGCFVFSDVPLPTAGLNELTLGLLGQDGSEIMSQVLRIRFEPDEAEVTTVTTVLPKPLYLETLDGLVPLAAKGAALPARCNQVFLRDNDNRNIAIRIFQRQEPIGTIRIEDIPPEGGRGSRVEMAVVVTEKNQIVGSATVTNPCGLVVKEAEVTVALEPPDIPSLEALAERFSTLQTALCAALATEEDPERSELLRGNAVAMIERARHMLDQQPPDRMEIFEALRELRVLVEPPADDMEPPRAAFQARVARCRKKIESLVQEARLSSTGEGIGHGQEPECPAPGYRSSPSGSTSRLPARATMVNRAQEILDHVARIEHEGLVAHSLRDHRAWGAANEALAGVESRFDRPSNREVTGSLVKAFGHMRVQTEISRLAQAEERLAQQGRGEDWQAEIHRLHRLLAALAEAVDDVDEDLPAHQIRSQLGVLLLQRLEPISRDITRIGLDIRKL